MKTATIRRLIAKDCFLMRRPLAMYTIAAAAAVALAAAGTSTRAAGITLALNVLIGLSFHVSLGPVLGERERRTLPFVMSLPITPREVAMAKLGAAYLMFSGPALVAAAALVYASPVDVFSAMANDGRSPIQHVVGWLAYFAVVLGVWLALFSVVLAVAVVTESLGATIAAVTGLMFVVGNGVLQVAPHLEIVGRYLGDLHHGGPALPATLAIEVLLIALITAIMLWRQGRKTSFV